MKDCSGMPCVAKLCLFIGLLLLPVTMAMGAGLEADTLVPADAVVEEPLVDPSAEVAEKGSFNLVGMIFGHIMDSHDWHILSIGDKHLTVPLPVIVYSRLRGEWHCFLSSRFHHGAASYAGFRLEVPPDGGRGVIVEDVAVGESQECVPRPVDLSITKNVFGIFFSCGLLLWVFIAVARRYSRNPGKAPHGLQNLLEPAILFVRDSIVIPTMGEEDAPRYLPILLTIFFFILFNNLLGLVPIFPAGANITGNITVTMTLALFTFVITTISGNRHYWRGIFNTPGVPWYMKFPVPMMPMIELIGIFTKPIVLMVRLFANMLSGHMIVLVFFSLIFLFGSINVVAGYGVSVISVIFAMFITLIDILVSFIQAYVFTMLSSMYFGMARSTSGH